MLPHTDSTKALRLEPGPQDVHVEAVRPREGGDTRPLSAPHVVALAESIAVLGLLEPLVLDTRGQLLAGAHRLAALQLLAIDDDQDRRDAFHARIDNRDEIADTTGWLKLAGRVHALGLLRKGRCPKGTAPALVVDVKDGDSDQTQRRALAVEVAENSVRRPYTKKEILDLAERLRVAGYTINKKGHPKNGEVTVIGVLQAAVGRSKRTIERILSKQTGGKSKWENARQTFFRVARRLQAEGKDQRRQADTRLLEAVARILKLENDGLG